MSDLQPRADLLATAEDLRRETGRPGLRILDVRWRPDGSGRAAWAAGHLPGSVHLDWAAELTTGADDAGVFRLAPGDLVAAALGRAGIGPETDLVVYDDSASLYAARVWWSLAASGFPSVRILDGGFGAWTAGGGPVTTDPTEVASTAPTAQDEHPGRVTWSDVRDLLRDPGVTFIDARPPAPSRGLANGRGLDHLARALVIPAAATTQPATGRFRDDGELQALFARQPLQRGRRYVCYDGSGIGSAKLAFAVRLLGHRDVAVYDGGWAEWGERGDPLL